MAVGDSSSSSSDGNADMAEGGGGGGLGLVLHPAYLADVRLTGPDQKGLLMKLTEMLAKHGAPLIIYRPDLHPLQP